MPGSAQHDILMAKVRATAGRREWAIPVTLLREIVDEVLEYAYLHAQGQDSQDRFREHGTSQMYWKGRSDAAMAVRKLKST